MKSFIKPRYMLVKNHDNAIVKKATILRLLADLGSGLLILTFLYAALTQLMNYARFLDVLSQSSLLVNFASFLAIAIPVMELLIVVMLFIPFTRFLGLINAAVLLLFITLYLLYMVLFADDLPCTCGGLFEWMSWGQHIILTIFLLFIAILSIFFLSGNQNTSSSHPP